MYQKQIYDNLIASFKNKSLHHSQIKPDDRKTSPILKDDEVSTIEQTTSSQSLEKILTR